jgi:hypothetical protein
MQIQCSSCQCKLWINEGSRGKRARCPKCNGLTVIPLDELAPQAKEKENVAERPLGRPPLRTKDDADDEFVEDRPRQRPKRRKSKLPWILAGVGALAVIGIIVAIVLIFFSDVGAGLQMAKATTAKYFQAYSQNDWDTALALYSPEFFQQTPKDQWRGQLPLVAAKLGDYQGHQLVGWRYMMGKNGNLVLNYQVNYTRGQANETFTFLGNGDGKQILISGHQIHSPALLKQYEVLPI